MNAAVDVGGGSRGWHGDLGGCILTASCLHLDLPDETAHTHTHLTCTSHSAAVCTQVLLVQQQTITRLMDLINRAKTALVEEVWAFMIKLIAGTCLCVGERGWAWAWVCHFLHWMFTD